VTNSTKTITGTKNTSRGALSNMVWSYHSVKELRQDYKQGEDVSIQEQRKLEKYIKRKKKTPNHKEWKKTQLSKPKDCCTRSSRTEKTGKP